MLAASCFKYNLKKVFLGLSRRQQLKEKARKDGIKTQSESYLFALLVTASGREAAAQDRRLMGWLERRPVSLHRALPCDGGFSPYSAPEPVLRKASWGWL